MTIFHLEIMVKNMHTTVIAYFFSHSLTRHPILLGKLNRKNTHTKKQDTTEV